MAMYDELVKRLREEASSWCVGCCFWTGECICTASDDSKRNCDIYSKLEAADAMEELMRRCEQFQYMPPPAWISVEERLPNCNGCYLVWRPHFFGGEIGMPSICYFDGTNTWHDSYGVDFTRILHPEDVTHWMPLPEPPKEI